MMSGSIGSAWGNRADGTLARSTSTKLCSLGPIRKTGVQPACSSRSAKAM